MVLISTDDIFALHFLVLLSPLNYIIPWYMGDGHCRMTMILCKYERGENTPSIDVAAKIADALGVTLDYLVKDAEYQQVDKETLKRLNDIQHLSPENKSHVFTLMDAFSELPRGKPRGIVQIEQLTLFTLQTQVRGKPRGIKPQID